MHTRAVILAGGEGTRLGVLTAKRTKPAVPFAGKYRIIDFTLSNCVNSNIFDLAIITQYRPQSLIHHIGSGGPWDLNREFTGGIHILTPFKTKDINWFSGTADAILRNFDYVFSRNPDNILILSGDHIYSMDYTNMIRYHQETDADVTLCVRNVPKNQASRFGVVEINKKKRITRFVEKPANPNSTLINMGVYLFKASVLREYILKDSKEITSQHDFGKNVLPDMVDNNVFMNAFQFDDYWVDVGTIQSYWKAHMDLLAIPPRYDIRKRNWVIHTRSEERPPAYIHNNSMINNSLICDGCIIEQGVTISNSVLSPGVVIKQGSSVKDSIILTDSEIQEGTGIYKTIIDKHAKIAPNSSIGSSGRDSARITMIGKNAYLPKDLIAHAGSMIACDVTPLDFESRTIEFGEFVLPKVDGYEV